MPERLEDLRGDRYLDELSMERASGRLSDRLGSNHIACSCHEEGYHDMDDGSMIRRYDLAALTSGDREGLFRSGSDDSVTAGKAAEAMIEAVRVEGDEALSRLALEVDGVDLDPSELQVDDGDFVLAFSRLDPELVGNLEDTVSDLRDLHEAELPKEIWLKQLRPGRFAGRRYCPIRSAAFYVPWGGGPGAMSAVLSTIPALVADVGKVVIVTPPGSDGQVDDAVLVAAATAGVGEIYMTSGLRAAAALAFGTERIPKVDKLIAPNEPGFRQAKKLLGDHLDIAMPAGKADAIILADESASGDAVARELEEVMGQGGDPIAFLVTPFTDLVDAVAERLKNTPKPPRGLILAPSMAAAVALVNEAAPSLLSVHAADPMTYLAAIDTAAEVRLGTAGMPYRSPLSVFDFLTRTAIGYTTRSLLIDEVGQAPKVETGGRGADLSASDRKLVASS